jgi:hypothetical protein
MKDMYYSNEALKYPLRSAVVFLALIPEKVKGR